MGGQEDGSPGAAQRAQLVETGADGGETASQGFFSRFFSAFGSDDADSADGESGGVASRINGTTGLGLGNLRRMRVEDVMLPKVEIVAVPDDVTEESLVETFRESGLTRLPVYNDTLDTPVGLVHLKDLALRHGFNGGSKPFDLQKMLRPLLFAPPSMPIGVLLQKMQSDRRHMALVIDEYGGVDGLVTIEDLIEQVIGRDRGRTRQRRRRILDAGTAWLLPRACQNAC